MEDKSQISDGYHTFAELYEHRHALFLALVKTMPEVFVMSWNHSDGKPFYALVERTREALAEPEPERPTDEEILELMPQQMRDDLAAAARALAGFDPDNIKVASVFRIILNRHCVDHARAVLARWGNHPEFPDSSTLQPVPVSERLPS